MGPGDFSLYEKAKSVVLFETKTTIPFAQSDSASAKDAGSNFEVDNGLKLSHAVDTAAPETNTLGNMDAVKESSAVDTGDNKEEETEQESTKNSSSGWICVIL